MKIVEIGKINTPIHDRSLSWPGTGTSVKSDGVKMLLLERCHNLSFTRYECQIPHTNRYSYTSCPNGQVVG
jgi:hypothetical protein